MDEFTVDAFVNRDDPIPVISFDKNDNLSEAEGVGQEGKDAQRRGLRKGLKDRFQRATSSSGTGSEGISMQDRLLEKYDAVYQQNEWTLTSWQTLATSNTSRRP
jgi:hypothetical protein